MNQQVINIGDKVSFHEDGGTLVCEVLEYKITAEEESARLRVLEEVERMFTGPATIGEEFAVWHKLGFACGLDWRIELT